MRYFRKTYGLSIVILLLLFAAETGKAQVRRYSTYTFSIDDGLSQNSVTCILKDKRGFIWLGTEDGLNRYDGKEVTTFVSKGNPEEGLIINTVNSLIEDRDKDLIYIGTNGGGLSIFDLNAEKFTHYPYRDSGNSISSGFVYDLFKDQSGNIIIATSYGVSIFNPDTKQFDNFESSEAEDAEFPFVVATSVFADENGVIWAGTYGFGLVKLDVASRTFTRYTNSRKEQRYNSNIIDEIRPSDESRYLWLATDNGFYEFDKETGRFRLLYLENTKVSDALVDKNGGIWLSSGLDGITYVSPAGTITSLKNDPYDIYSLEENSVRCLYLDDREHLWIGTKSSGCIHMDVSGNQFVHYYQTKDGKGVNGKTVFALSKDKQQQVWVGTMKGLSIWDASTGNIRPYYFLDHQDDVSVWALYNDNDDLWIGTSQGLFKHNKISRSTDTYKYIEGDSTSLSDNEVFAIEKDAAGNLWIGTAYGLSKFDPSADKFIRYQFANYDGALTNEMIWDVYCDSKERLWVTTQYGVNIYRPETDSFTYLFNTDADTLGLSSYNVTSVYEDSRNRIWLTTSKGINLVNDSLHIIKHYGEEQGLANAYTYHLYEHNNELWVSTNKGISRINLETEDVISYDVQDGLQSNEFNPASEILDDGRMLFGGINGFNVFHPDSIKQSTFSPPIYFTSLELYDQAFQDMDSLAIDRRVVRSSLLNSDQITLDAEQRFFTINFTALDYQAPLQIDYYYRMLPISPDWIPLDDKRNLTFIDLNIGQYKLEVRSTNAEGYFCDNAKRITIIVQPPLWKEPWFVVLSVLMAIVLVYMAGRLYYLRMKRDKEVLEKRVHIRTKEIQLQRNIAHRQRDEIARQKEELEHLAKNLEGIVDERTRELKLAKEAAEESDRLKSAFLSNMSHEIRTPMNAIMGFSELLLDSSFNEQEKNDFAHLIRTNGDNLLHLLNDIIDISMIESGQLKVVLTQIDVNELIKEVFETFKTSRLLQEKPVIKYELICANEPIILQTDAFRLRQILNNLISNAIKFTNSGYIKVALKEEGNQALFSVEDSGIGISLEHQTRIFERFSRIDNTNENLYGGNGLGLTITKNLVEILKGSINVESELGVGTNFYFQLPLTKHS
ncbi:hypothetical protein KDU71_17770 [Carboxylicivirga sediminis]|uniref:histidine kinase n=1 Tax=Carboxylicivirga sediminis TaxID=2006564 RepID=A0A941IY16_9BACT|nr:hybrid sensor histidine kinase/response regulator [Carboxylicivirga sediminis]MBR8537421.1 hypothetical protein [Carboxylicivirga sediminis]